MIDLFTWEDGGGWEPSGGQGRIIGNDWEYKPPRGRTVRGTADSPTEAREAVEEAHRQYAMRCWAKGTPGRHGGFVCPLV